MQLLPITNFLFPKSKGKIDIFCNKIIFEESSIIPNFTIDLDQKHFCLFLFKPLDGFVERSSLFPCVVVNEIFLVHSGFINNENVFAITGSNFTNMLHNSLFACAYSLFVAA